MYTKEAEVSRNILIIHESLILSILFIKLKKDQPQFYNQLNVKTNKQTNKQKYSGKNRARALDLYGVKLLFLGQVNMF